MCKPLEVSHALINLDNRSIKYINCKTQVSLNVCRLHFVSYSDWIKYHPNTIHERNNCEWQNLFVLGAFVLFIVDVRSFVCLHLTSICSSCSIVFFLNQNVLISFYFNRNVSNEFSSITYQNRHNCITTIKIHLLDLHNPNALLHLQSCNNFNALYFASCSFQVWLVKWLKANINDIKNSVRMTQMEQELIPRSDNVLIGSVS